MRNTLAFLLTAAMATASGAAAAATPLPSLQWDYRVIAAFTDDATQARELTDTFQTADGITKRHIAWFVVSPDDISSNLDPADIPSRDRLEQLHTVNGFQTVLVGKDGGVKARQNDSLDLNALYEQIDSMPMRQREMREQR